MAERCLAGAGPGPAAWSIVAVVIGCVLGGSVRAGYAGGSSEYVGPPGDTWFAAENWSNGEIPQASSSVVIGGSVIVDQPGAVANSILILGGGTLTVGEGSLTAPNIIVQESGTLVLDDAGAEIEVILLAVGVGGAVTWNAGTATIAVAWNDGNAVEIGMSGPSLLTLPLGAAINAPSVSIGASATLRGTGTVNAALTNSGRVEPGLPLGTLTVTGAYTQLPSGTLAIDVDGYVADLEHDVLEVSGVAFANGALEVSVLPGFVPQLFEPLGFLQAVPTAGTFSESFDALPGIMSFDTTYNHDPEDEAFFVTQLFVTVTETASRLFVQESGLPDGDAQSWASAVADLQDALQISALFPGEVSEVWVAAGTYRPRPSPGDRVASFHMQTDLAVYGGFAGGETALEDRDVAANPTILSGDLAGNDGPDFTGNDENTFHLVRSLAPTTGARLDGFTITGGNADHSGARGAGLHNSAADTVVANCTFVGNWAIHRGGAVFVTQSSAPLLQDCTIEGNECFEFGGGLASDGTSTPSIVDCLITGNTAATGAGIHIAASSLPSISGSLVCENDPDNLVGAFEDAGGNTIGDVCVPPCPTDLDGDGATGVQDLVQLILAWGPCPGCSGDLDGDGQVGVQDLVTLIIEWGPCG